MNKSALKDIQQALNAIRGKIERTDNETNWAARELMLSANNSLVALTKQMAKPETVTCSISILQSKFVEQPQQQLKQQPSQSKNTPNGDTDATALGISYTIV
tara:strand:+ start:1354 stop:1659 length:306 start_codon:yes stop_codon:yes gene_type:complete